MRIQAYSPMTMLALVLTFVFKLSTWVSVVQELVDVACQGLDAGTVACFSIHVQRFQPLPYGATDEMGV